MPSTLRHFVPASLCGLLACLCSALAEAPAWQPVPFDPQAAREELSRLISQQVLRHAAEEFTVDDDWGETTEVFAGWDVWREDEGFGIDTKRRWREVKHGTWKRCQLSLIDPDKNLRVDVAQIEPLSDGGWSLTCRVDCPVQWSARVSRWQKGMQWISLSAEGRAHPSLEIALELRAALALADSLPAIQLQPRVAQASLQVKDLRIKHVNRVGGEPAQQLSRLLERELREEYLPGINRKLAGRLNRQLEKHGQQMRLTMDRLIPRDSMDATEAAALGDGSKPRIPATP
jgi:hypothetical protein